MADPTEYQVPQLDQEKAMDQYPPETDKQPLIGAEPPRPMLALEVHPQPRLAPEVHPQPRSLTPQQYPPQYGQGLFGTMNIRRGDHWQAGQTTALVTQPTSLHISQQHDLIKPGQLIYISLFTMLCCGFLPGCVAFVCAWEARNMWRTGEIEDARSWTSCSIFFNVLGVLLGVITTMITILISTHQL